MPTECHPRPPDARVRCDTNRRRLGDLWRRVSRRPSRYVTVVAYSTVPGGSVRLSPEPLTWYTYIQGRPTGTTVKESDILPVVNRQGT